MTVLAVVAAACGDDSVETLAKEDYVAQGIAICAALNEVLNTEFAELVGMFPEPLETPEEFEAVAKAANAMFDEVITPHVEEFWPSCVPLAHRRKTPICWPIRRHGPRPRGAEHDP